jgi:iron-sulfur cluster repair protein YtfE (RIC family)
MVITTTLEEFQAPLNKQLQTHMKKDSNLFFPTCYNFLIQKQQLVARKIAKLNVFIISNNILYYI